MQELKEKERRAIEVLKAFEPEDGYYLCYSGGKDSDCIRILADLAGVKHEIHHNLTTADAPETVYYVKSIPNVIIDKPEISMWRLIEKKHFPPTRVARYCCEELKERGGKGRLMVTGVRAKESRNRSNNHGLVTFATKGKTISKIAESTGAANVAPAKRGLILNIDDAPSRRLVEQCYRTSKTMVNPIIDWSDADVWDFLKAYGCKSNPLYECGVKRVGCIGCPMAGHEKQKKEFEMYPKYRSMYVAAFDRMLEAREKAGKPRHTKTTSWIDGEAVMRWWLGEDETQILWEDIGLEV